MTAATRSPKATAANAGGPTPGFFTESHLVAFIDILGFRHEISHARTHDELSAIHRKMRFVQREFAKSSAMDDPVRAEDLNRQYGKRVLALSDAVVVAISLRCPANDVIDDYDLVGSSLWDIVAAQARCACNGIFVRGGVSHGPFYFEDDILLSPALAEAYELETQAADYPVIAVAEATRAWVLGRGKRHIYAADADPNPRYFRETGRRWQGGHLYFLDYLGIMVNEQHRGMVSPERKAYRAALRRKNYALADRIVDRSAYRDAAYFLGFHRREMERAYLSTSSEKVRRKYRWLMRYHNESFRRDLPFLREQVIDLRKFPVPRRS